MLTAEERTVSGKDLPYNLFFPLHILLVDEAQGSGSAGLGVKWE